MKCASELIKIRQKAKEEWEKERVKALAELLKDSIEFCESVISPALEKEAMNFKEKSIKTTIEFVEIYNAKKDIYVLNPILLSSIKNGIRYYKPIEEIEYNKEYIEKYLQEHCLCVNWNSIGKHIEHEYSYQAILELTVEVKFD